MARPEKREDLLDAAIRLFNRYGYRATGVDRLMAETGIAKTTLYRHFKSKEELIIAALDRIDEAERDEMRTFVEAASSDPMERIFAMFTLLDHWLRDEDFKGCPFMAAASEFGDDRNDPIFQQVKLHKRLFLAYIEELVRAARIPEPARVARQIMMLQAGMIAFAQVMGPDGLAEDARKATAQIIEAAIRCDRERETLRACS